MYFNAHTLLLLFLPAAAVVVKRPRDAPNKFPTNGDQPVPDLFKSDPDNTYLPEISPELGTLRDGLPDPNSATAQNKVGTWLYGYNKCNIPPFNKKQINDAYYDHWMMTNRGGTKKNIDWNSAAALEFLAPPGNNKDQQSRIQKIFENLAETIYGSPLSPFGHYIHVRCDDPYKQCPSQCDPPPGDENPDHNGGTIAYSDQEDPDDVSLPPLRERNPHWFG